MPEVTYAIQGWSAADRDTFYTTSQGSHMMPYAWFKALRRLDADQPFAGDQLQRYGYLPNEVSKSNPEGLPVGFVIDGSVDSGQVGMTCAACHTGQLEYQKAGATHALRLDGAPANADFQQFLTDLAAASRATLMQPERFDTFAKAVLGPGYTAAKSADLNDAFGKWVGQFTEFMDKSLPSASVWGPGRLDAFGMIFNRVSARDLGILDNFRRSRTLRSVTRSCGMPRGRTTRNGTAAYPTDSISRRLGAIPARCSASSLISRPPPHFLPRRSPRR